MPPNSKEYMRAYRAAQKMQKSVDELGAGRPSKPGQNARGTSARAEIDRLFRENQELREMNQALLEELAQVRNNKPFREVVDRAKTVLQEPGFNTRPFRPVPKK